MVGTFGGALEARKINASNKHLTAEVRGEIETEDKVLVIRRIHVVYHLTAPAGAQETIERVHRIHANKCPVFRSLHKAIEITTQYKLYEPS
ncbi:MAG: OsmC family protein [Acidobacteria bacterium]|nr:OsmC family protein [Acidobacteriota bacterium]